MSDQLLHELTTEKHARGSRKCDSEYHIRLYFVPQKLIVKGPLIDLAKETMHSSADATTPGEWLVDVMQYRKLEKSLSAFCILMNNSALPSRLGSNF